MLESHGHEVLADFSAALEQASHNFHDSTRWETESCYFWETGDKQVPIQEYLEAKFKAIADELNKIKKYEKILRKQGYIE